MMGQVAKMRASEIAAAFVVSVLGLGLGCGDDSGPGGAGGAGGAGASGAGSQGGSGGAGGTGGEDPPVCFVPTTDPTAPTPEDVQFAPVGQLLAGEQILFNDWNQSPNELLAMRPDGTAEAWIFSAYRIWSFGVSRSSTQIAFAAGDPMQEQNYGITIGDAIQPTFVYDEACGTVGALTWGNLNDECHSFGPGDDYLYLCRRYDFDDTGAFSGYRVGRVSMATQAFEWLTPEDDASYRLSAQPLGGETDMIYYRIPLPTGTRSVVRAPISGGTESVIRDDAGYPHLSPDGTRILVSDTTQGGSIVSIDLSGGDDVLVAEGESLTTMVYSPDGSRVAFLRWDDAVACSHVEVAAADGSEATSPTRIHDCGMSGRFITELAWIVK
jgi:hypothetical protein